MATKPVVVSLNGHKLTIKSMYHKVYKDDEVTWRCDDAEMHIKFNYPGEDSPFLWNCLLVPQGLTTSSGPPRPGQRLRRYTIIIHHNEYSHDVTIDPEVDVDGGDPGTHKKATKKTATKAQNKTAARKAARKR